MALKIIFYVLTLFILDAYAFSNNSYLITVPATFRPGMAVNMNILILRAKPPDAAVTVNATFLIDSKRITTASGQFYAGQTGSLQLQIPSEGFPENSVSYQTTKHLEVIGSGGLTFNETKSRSVKFVKKGVTIYVQTDKGIYKPGQTVHMRIVAVYPSLKVHTGKMTLTISDPKNNKLAMWKDENTASGVVSKDFELSSQPNIGKWKISVDIEGQTKETTFEVKEYVLPKFEVKIVANSYASKGNGEIRGTVTAKYTYGKNVEGKAKLSAYFPCYSRECEKYELNFEMDGSHSFVISKERITKLYPYSYGDPYSNNYGYQVVLNASVTEKLTQKTYFGEATVKTYKSAVALKYAESNPKAYKAGFPFQALIEVTRPDGSPVPNILVSVSSTTYPGSQELSKAYTSDENGYVIFQRTIGEDVTSLNIN
ncbi:CD109 antigen-like, partial [Paramuricea clavata]